MLRRSIDAKRFIYKEYLAFFAMLRTHLLRSSKYNYVDRISSCPLVTLKPNRNTSANVDPTLAESLRPLFLNIPA